MLPSIFFGVNVFGGATGQVYPPHDSSQSEVNSPERLSNLRYTALESSSRQTMRQYQVTPATTKIPVKTLSQGQFARKPLQRPGFYRLESPNLAG
jgi:ATPase subunit of ABC transporter with duplicated ATPase domains